jgi:tetratricopeptide (TPR) repeat protein
VLQPGFSREAAVAVAGADLATLRALGEGGLLGSEAGGERYALHELVRQYAAERLAARRAEEDGTRARHAAFYAALVEGETPGLRRTAAAQAAIGADIANIRLAWEWAAERAEVAILERMLAGLARWYDFRGLPGEASEALDQAARRLRAVLGQAAAPDPSMQRLLGSILAEGANALLWQGSTAQARPMLEEAHSLARAAVSPRLEGRVAYVLGWLLTRQRDLRNAMHSYQRALALARAAHDAALEADALGFVGGTAILAGDYRQAPGYLEPALALFRAQQDRFGEAGALYYLGLEAHARGEFGEARHLLEEVLQLARAPEYHLIENTAMHQIGLIEDEGWGRHLAAEDLFAQELRISQRAGDRIREGFALAALGRNSLYQGDLGRAGELLDRALDLSQEVGGRESAALALRGQSLLAHYLVDDQRARRCAEEALAVARATGMRREERLALRLLGHALLGLGEREAAREVYQQVVDLDELLGFAHLRVETATDLARAALAQGDTARAAALAAGVVPDLERAAVAGLEEPALAYLSCYRALDAAGGGPAAGMLAAGHALLEGRAAQFLDEGRRSRYLGDLPAHRELLAAWHARGGEALPGAAAGRPQLRRPV